MEIKIDVSSLYKNEGDSNARLSELDNYIQKAKVLAGEGNNIILTGQAPVWLYLKIAHALHGKVRKLTYRSPLLDVVIFDHSS